jgi:hypothetical protein
VPFEQDRVVLEGDLQAAPRPWLVVLPAAGDRDGRGDQ